MKSILYLLGLIVQLSWAVTGLHAQETVSSLHVMFEDEDNANTLFRTADLVPASDGGYYRVGTFRDGEFARALVSKLDADYDVEWSYRVNLTLNGGGSFQASYGTSLVELEDGSLLLLCAANMALLSNNPLFQNLDYTIVRFTPGTDPEILSAHCYGDSFADIPHTIIPTADGGFLLSGYSNGEQALNAPSVVLTYLVKLNAALELEWEQRLRPEVTECRTDGFTLYNQGMLRRVAVETQDGGYIFTAQCDEFTYYSKVATDGTFLWSKRFASAGGILEGQVNEDWGFVLGAGGGGAVTAIQELESGDLAFLGNQLYFFFSLLGFFLEDPQGGGEGVSLPMSYVFVTDSDGNYRYGTAFFFESGQSTMPIDMVTDAFVPLEGSCFLVAGKINRFVQDNVYSYAPALFEVDAAAEEFNEGISEMYRILPGETEFYHRQNQNDYPWGLDPVTLLRDGELEEIILTYDDQLLELTGTRLDALEDCIEEVATNRIYSFPFSVDIVDFGFTSNPLMNFPVTINSLIPRTLTTTENCAASIIVNTQNLKAPAENLPYLRTTVIRESFQLEAPMEWHGAEVRLVNVAGQVLYHTQIYGALTELSASNLLPGLYFVQVGNSTERAVLKGVVVQ